MSQRRGSDDGPCQPGDGDLPELPPEWGQIVIPDDPRELAAEAEAVRAELGAERRQQFYAGRSGRFGLSGPLIALVLMLVAAMASLMVIALPYSPERPVRAPLASPTAASGQLGSLLPDVRLVDDRGAPVSVRDIRPAVLLLMPTGCDCHSVAADLVRVSRDAMVSVELVGTDKPPQRPPASPRDRIFTLADPTDAITRAVGNGRTPGTTAGPPVPVSGPTAVLVRANGVIAGVVLGLADASQLRAELAGLTIT